MRILWIWLFMFALLCLPSQFAYHGETLSAGLLLALGWSPGCFMYTGLGVRGSDDQKSNYPHWNWIHFWGGIWNCLMPWGDDRRWLGVRVVRKNAVVWRSLNEDFIRSKCLSGYGFNEATFLLCMSMFTHVRMFWFLSSCPLDFDG